MATKKSLTRARVTTDRAKAAEKAQAISKLQEALQLSDPPSESSTIDESHSPLDFPESDTPMAPPSDSEGVTAPRTRSRKRTVSEVSKSETLDVPVVNKPVKKTGLKPKPKCVPKESVASHKVPRTDSESDGSVVEPVWLHLICCLQDTEAMRKFLGRDVPIDKFDDSGSITSFGIVYSRSSQKFSSIGQELAMLEHIELELGPAVRWQKENIISQIWLYH
ncbi:hypothetical protein B0H14DRAFT_2569251 [Mycena olivaceomarginata]|nr:hypothetical protein B0H14DRAFT_2569251 [Mycena olivaceomarginata]